MNAVRTAWCSVCNDAQQSDDIGCLVCEALREKSRPTRAVFMRKRRARLNRSGVCINAISHGSPEPGKTKCTACLVVHRRSNRRAS